MEKQEFSPNANGKVSDKSVRSESTQGSESANGVRTATTVLGAMSTKVQHAVEEAKEEERRPFRFAEMMQKLNQESHEGLKQVKEDLKEANQKTSLKEMRLMADKTKKMLAEQCNIKQQIIDKKKAVSDFEKAKL